MYDRNISPEIKHMIENISPEIISLLYKYIDINEKKSSSIKAYKYATASNLRDMEKMIGSKIMNCYKGDVGGGYSDWKEFVRLIDVEFGVNILTMNINGDQESTQSIKSILRELTINQLLKDE